MTLLDLPHGKTQINEARKFNRKVDNSEHDQLLWTNQKAKGGVIQGVLREIRTSNEKYKEGGGGVTRDPWGEETHL